MDRKVKAIDPCPLITVRLATAEERRRWNSLNHYCTDRAACRKKMGSRILKQIVTFNNSIVVVLGFFLYQEKCYFITEI